MAFSPDGRTIASGSEDKTMKLWDAASGRELRTLTENRGGVAAIAFSPNGRTIISGAFDRTVRYWSVSGDLLATLVSVPDGEWVTITPEGFFDASENGAKYLTVVRGLEAYSIDQFKKELYRPDLVREKLAGDPRGKVREAAAKLDLSKAMATGNAPSVVITAPVAGSSVQTERTTVEVTVSEQGGGGNWQCRMAGQWCDFRDGGAWD